MQIAIVGLGKMGGNMVRRLLQGGHQVVAWDRDDATVAKMVKEGAVGASSLSDLVSKLAAPRAVDVLENAIRVGPEAHAPSLTVRSMARPARPPAVSCARPTR